MRKLITPIVVILLITTGKLNAGEVSTLIPDSDTGTVTQAEIDRFDTYYKVFYKIPTNNDKKDMTWDLSPFIHSLIFMYETTGDREYLDYAMVCCERIQNAKRTNDIDYVTQRIIPGWAYFFDQFTDSTGNPAMYNNVVGNGAVIRAMSNVARVIRRDNLPESYQRKARTYIESCTETINGFIDHSEWYDSTARLFHFPDNQRHDDCLPGVRGLTTAFNRQLLMAAGMLNVVKYYEINQSESELRSKYTSIIESIAHYFWNSLTAHSSGDSTYYLWMYREEGKNGGPPRLEDVGHGGYDIKCIVQIHADLGIGTETQLSYLGNTFFDHLQYNKEEHAFADKIDGSDPEKNPMTQRRKSMRWMALSDYDRRVFENAGWQLTNGVKISEPLPYCEFLYYRAKYYGTDLSVSVMDPSPIKSDTPQISLFPNPSGNTINISYSVQKKQSIKINLIEPLSGRTCKTIFHGIQNKGSFNIPLDISELNQGFYLIMIQTEERCIGQKFIKN